MNPSKFSPIARKFCRNKLHPIALAVFLVLLLACIFAPFLTPYDYQTINLPDRDLGSTATYPLGTDALGRDMLTRLLYGGQMTFSITLRALALGALGGSLLGILSGYYGSWLDTAVMRLVDILSAIPNVLLAVAAECIFGWGQGNYMYAIAVALIPAFSKVVRACVMNVRSSTFVEGARALGLSDLVIISRHILPNIIAPVLIQLSAAAADAFLMCTILGYIGIGVTPPIPELGAMAAQEFRHIRAFPMRSLLPSGFIVLCALSINIIGNGLRDALDLQGQKSNFGRRGNSWKN